MESHFYVKKILYQPLLGLQSPIWFNIQKFPEFISKTVKHLHVRNTYDLPYYLALQCLAEIKNAA